MLDVGLGRLAARLEAPIERLEKFRMRLVEHVERLEGSRPEETVELAAELAEAVPAGARSLIPRLGRVTRGGQGGAPPGTCWRSPGGTTILVNGQFYPCPSLDLDS
jgi:hypothetical protein